MSKICQEKFEWHAPLEKPEERGWVSVKTAQTKKGLKAGELVHYSNLPPGSNIEDQEAFAPHNQPFSMGGQTDVSKDWNSESVRRGFSTYRMRPTDDLYTNEHCDAFYGEIGIPRRRALRFIIH